MAKEYDQFDIKAFRGHFRIAASHFEKGVGEFEKLQSLYRNASQQVEYWQTRCELFEKILAETPCDPDITPEQCKAWRDLDRFLTTVPNPSKSTKKEKKS
jgi:hypothetical protein